MRRDIWNLGKKLTEKYLTNEYHILLFPLKSESRRDFILHVYLEMSYCKFLKSALVFSFVKCLTILSSNEESRFLDCNAVKSGQSSRF
jgi:hypothetical protein